MSFVENKNDKINPIHIHLWITYWRSHHPFSLLLWQSHRAKAGWINAGVKALFIPPRRQWQSKWQGPRIRPSVWVVLHHSSLPPTDQTQDGVVVHGRFLSSAFQSPVHFCQICTVSLSPYCTLDPSSCGTFLLFTGSHRFLSAPETSGMHAVLHLYRYEYISTSLCDVRALLSAGLISVFKETQQLVALYRYKILLIPWNQLNQKVLCKKTDKYLAGDTAGEHCSMYWLEHSAGMRLPISTNTQKAHAH